MTHRKLASPSLPATANPGTSRPKIFSPISSEV